MHLLPRSSLSQLVHLVYILCSSTVQKLDLCMHPMSVWCGNWQLYLVYICIGYLKSFPQSQGKQFCCRLTGSGAHETGTHTHTHLVCSPEMDPHATCPNVTSLSSETTLVELQNWSSSAIATAKWRQLKRDRHSNKDKDREIKRARKRVSQQWRRHQRTCCRCRPGRKPQRATSPAGVFCLCHRYLCPRCLPVGLALVAATAHVPAAKHTDVMTSLFIDFS